MVSGPFSALPSSPPAAAVSPGLLMVSPQLQRLPLPLPSANRRISPRTSGKLLPNHAAGLRAEHRAGPSLQVHLLQRLGLLHLFRLTGDPITITEKPRKSVYPQPSQPGRSRPVCLPCQPGLHVGPAGFSPCPKARLIFLLQQSLACAPRHFADRNSRLRKQKPPRQYAGRFQHIFTFYSPIYSVWYTSSFCS